MKFTRIITLLSITMAFCACTEEVIDLTPVIGEGSAEGIMISPQWDAADYRFKCAKIKDASFSIISKPGWLTIESNSGKFTDSVATIHGKATLESKFSKAGFHNDQMVIMSGGTSYNIPLTYISEGNPSVEVKWAYDYYYDRFYKNLLQVVNSVDGILIWDIVSLPSWLKVNMEFFDAKSLILPKGSVASIPLDLNVWQPVQGVLTGTIVLKSNDKSKPLIEIPVSANLGTPDVAIITWPIDFGSSETSKTASFANHGDGILCWRFEELPEWLTVSPASGMLLPDGGGSGHVTFTCDRGKLQNSFTSATIKLKSNDPDRPSVDVVFNVRRPGVTMNVRALEGNIVNAAFNKATNTMYYVTSQPDKLVAYDVTTRTVSHEVTLSKAPTCMAINEDFKKAVVGHGGMISLVDLTSYTVAKSYDLAFTVHDIEWGEGDWFCYTRASSTTSNLLWKNTSSDEIHETVGVGNLPGSADLKKIPNQPYIIASKWDPACTAVFDIASKTMKSYTNKSIGNPMFLDGSESMITLSSHVILTSTLTALTGTHAGVYPATGRLKVEDFPYITWWADFSAAKQSIWAIFSVYEHSLIPPSFSPTIYQYDDTNYTFVKSYTYDIMYQPSAQSPTHYVEARYIFANSPGSELTVLRKGKDNNIWSIEFIPVE